MPVTTRRRAAALAAVRPSALKKSTSTPKRISQTPTHIKTEEPKRAPSGKVTGHRRRLKSLSTADDSYILACQFGHRLYDGAAPLKHAATVSPTLKHLISADVEHQARFYERKLAQVSADMAASGEVDLWVVHDVIDVAIGMLRKIGKV